MAAFPVVINARSATKGKPHEPCRVFGPTGSAWDASVRSWFVKPTNGPTRCVRCKSSLLACLAKRSRTESTGIDQVQQKSKKKPHQPSSRGAHGDDPSSHP